MGDNMSSRRDSSMLILLALHLALPAKAAQGNPPAQQRLELPSSGEIVVEGAIESSDPQESGRLYDEYRLPLARGEAIQIDMEAITAREPDSGLVDSHLLLSPQARAGFVITNEDRANGSINARIYYAAPFDDVFLLRASGAQAAGSAAGAETPGRTGGYRLTVRRIEPITTSIPLGSEIVNGAFDDNSPLAVAGSTPYRQHLYTFNASSGERVRLEMTSSDFASSLQLVDSMGRVVARGHSEIVAGPTARIASVIDSPGTYTVRAQAPLERQGRYVLALTRLPTPTDEPVRPVRVGSAIGGSFDEETSPVFIEDDGGFGYLYRDYSIRLNAGETVTVSLTSDEFDPVLEVGAMTMFGFAPALVNDDSGEDLNSRLVLRPTRAGTALIRVRSLDLSGGSYRLEVQRGEPAPAVDQATPLG